MQNKTKTKGSIESTISSVKSNRYLSKGQVAELEKLREYKKKHEIIIWECQDDWFQ